MGKAITSDNCDDFVDALYKSPDYLKKVFGKKSVALYNVNAFFMQLVAENTLSFQWKDNEVIFMIVRNEQVKHRYKKPINWEGFEFLSLPS